MLWIAVSQQKTYKICKYVFETSIKSTLKVRLHDRMQFFKFKFFFIIIINYINNYLYFHYQHKKCVHNSDKSHFRINATKLKKQPKKISDNYPKEKIEPNG